MRDRLYLIVVMQLLAASSLRAADHLNLEEGLPTDLTDATVLPLWGREYQVFGRWEQADDGTDSFTLTNRFEFGFPRNTQLSVAIPAIFGEVEPDGLGDVEVEALYNLNAETLTLPAFTFGGVLHTPTGEDSHGVDPGVKLLMTKTLPGTDWFQQIHANLTWWFNDDVQPGERGGGYKAVVGYSARVGPRATLILDLVREETEFDHEEFNLAEAGLRFQVNPRAVLSTGVGAGFGDESPDVRVTLGLQLTF